MKYRYDIQELRGFAVFFVVFFHINVLQGGFVGVDIFFVISGYLITSIIINTKEKNSFSLYKFYQKRTVRIIPLSCLIIFFTNKILKYKNILGKEFLDDGIFCLFLIFNIMQSRKKESYFDSIYKTPFLHFWSLTVEEQFYLFWPVIIGIVNKTKLIPFLSILAISLSYYIYYLFKRITSSYFFSVCRFWEFISGGIINLFKFETKYDLQQKNINITVIIFCTIIIKNENRILLPLFILIVVLYIQNDRANDILNNRIIIFLGEISYSIYLIHYPLIILFKLRIYYFLLIILISSTITYYLIEKQLNKAILFYVVLILWILSVVSIIYEKKRIDINNRRIPYIQFEENNYKEQKDMWCSHCHYEDKNKYQALLIGDSHVEQWIPAIYDMLKEKGISIHHYYMHPNFVSQNKYKAYHFQHFNKSNVFEITFISFALRSDWLDNRRSFDFYFTSFISFFLTLSKFVVAIDDTPLLEPVNLCQTCCKRQTCTTCYGITGSNITIIPSLPDYNDKRVIHLNFNKYFCENNKCYCQRENLLVFEMWNHIYPSYIKTLSHDFQNIQQFKHLKYTSSIFNSSCKYYMKGNLFLRDC